MDDKTNEPEFTDAEFEEHLRRLGVRSDRPEHFRWRWQKRRDERKAMEFLAFLKGGKR